MCLDAEVSKPTASGGQTLVRLKMRNLISRAVFDKTFKAPEKFAEPDLVVTPAVKSRQVSNVRTSFGYSMFRNCSKLCPLARNTRDPTSRPRLIATNVPTRVQPTTRLDCRRYKALTKPGAASGRLWRPMTSKVPATQRLSAIVVVR